MSLDKATLRRQAQQSPELLLAGVDSYPLVIDEAHKAPAIFDEIKASVDEQRRPGRYVLSGSVQFSKKVGVRESLTGRTATIRLDTMSVSETLDSKQATLKDLKQYLECGGMPGVCFLRDSGQRNAYWEQWLETTCYRDMKVFSLGRLSGDLARAILEACALEEFPDLSHLSKRLKVASHRVKNHLDALEDLFVIRVVQPDLTAQIRKPLYHLFDAGLAFYLGASLRRRWQSWFLTEAAIQAQLSGKSRHSVTYYRSRRGSFIDFMVGRKLHLFQDQAMITRPELLMARAALRAAKATALEVHIPTDQPERKLEPGILLVPWRVSSALKP